MENKKDMELRTIKRKESLDQNLNNQEENEQKLDAFYFEDKNEIKLLEQKQKETPFLSKKMKYFCLILLLLLTFLLINVSLLIISKQKHLYSPYRPLTNETNTEESNITIIDKPITKNNDSESNKTEPLKNLSNLTYPRLMKFIINQTISGLYDENEYSPYPQTLLISLYLFSEDEFNLKIQAENQTIFTLPESYPFPFPKDLKNTDSDSDRINPNYVIEYTTIMPFTLKIIRKTTLEILFDSSEINFIYSSRYIEFGTKLPTNYLYGLGERNSEFLYKPGVYTIWNHKSLNEIDTGTPGHQSSGTHPVYLVKEKAGLFNMVFLKTVNGLLFELNEKNQLIFKLSGGIIDFTLFLGDQSPETVVVKYHKFINGFNLNPFWMFGSHIVIKDNFKEIEKKYKENDIPLDVIWGDNNDNNLDFFETKYKKILIMDLGIRTNDNKTIEYGLTQNLFIKSAKNHKPIVNCINNDTVLFPDFNHPNITIFWDEYILPKIKFYNGISIIYNEPTFPKLADNNEELICDPEKVILLNNNYTFLNQILDYFEPDDLPLILQKNLEKETLPISSYHYNVSKWGLTGYNFQEIDFHNLNGFLSSYTTYLISNKNNFVVSTDSNLFGNGNFSIVVTESQFAWTFLKISISKILNSGLFSIPIIGFDICNSQDLTGEELCARWLQLACLCPYFRINDQGIFIKNVSTNLILQLKKTIKMRYSLVKYLYSLLVMKNGRGMVWKPMFFEFPNEDTIYNYDTQYMIGRNILIAPVVEQGLFIVSVYLPKFIKWLHLETEKIYINSNGFKIDIESMINQTVPLFIREGSIINFQNTDSVNNINELDNVFRLIAMVKNISKNEYYAEGYIIVIKEFNENWMSKCFDQPYPYNKNKCLIKLSVRIDVLPAPDYIIQAIIEVLDNEEKELEEVWIESLAIYGIQIGNQFIKKNLNFESRIRLEKNYKKTFVLA